MVAIVSLSCRELQEVNVSFIRMMLLNLEWHTTGNGTEAFSSPSSET